MMKKKNLFAIFTIALFAATNSFAAWLVVKNQSKEPVWARIDNQMRRGLTPEENKAYKWKMAMAITPALSVVLAPLSGWFVMNLNKEFKSSPAFLKIEPGKSKIFRSGLTAIEEVTFLRVKDTETKTIPRESLLAVVQPLTSQYGNIYALNYEYADSPYTLYIDLYSGISQKYTSLEINVPIPVLETFKIEPDIAGTNLFSRIEYNEWKKAKRTQ